MDPKLVCRMFFGLGVAVDLGGLLFPWFKEDIMNYGSRNRNMDARPNQKSKSILESISSLQVPHSWFTYLYVFSVASSAFWGYQIVMQGAAFRLLAASSPHDATDGMSAQQTGLLWGLMALQGIRRLYESIIFTKPTSAKMWAGLWIIGIAYYLFTGIGVWIEGIASVNIARPLVTVLQFSRPSTKTIVALPMFTAASIIQHVCHRHLSSLKKYTLPHHPFFQYIVCPHYTSECFIYLALAIAAAPSGFALNRTVLAGLIFVVSNLGVTANATRTWSIEKFGADKVEGRWRIFPLVY